MALFKIKGGVAKKVLAESAGLERTLQQIFESNLQEILGVTFLAHEYVTSFGGRIDTLGIDDNGSPVIIEYKRGQDGSVINQGLSYLRWLLDHKAEFEKLVSESPSLVYEDKQIPGGEGSHESIHVTKRYKLEIDWSSPRVICIAEQYNKFDLDTADLLPINIELYRYRLYDGELLYVESEAYQKVKLSGLPKSIRTVSQRDKSLQKDYSLDDHLKRTSAKVKALYLELREKIMALDEDIIEQPKKYYVAYKLSKNFADIMVGQGRYAALKIALNMKSGSLNDPHGLARDMTKPKPVGHVGNGDYEVKLNDKEKIEEVFELIKQSYNYNK